MNNKILIICADPVPLIEVPVSGAALRAWSLGQGLRSRGFKVQYAYWQKGTGERFDVPPDLISFHPSDLSDILVRQKPRVVVFQHWPLLLYLKEPVPCPVAVDLHGPLLIEMIYQERDDYHFFLTNKVIALSKADYICCAGYRQQQYFRSWLLAAGIDIRGGLPDVIPISLSPNTQPKQYNEEITFVFGGHFLPWQDPSLVLETLVECLEQEQKGKLQIFGGTHPTGEIPSGVYESLMPTLKTNRHVQFMGMITREELLKHYLKAHVAIDLMQRNPERELAFTTRTIEYLWCGLPPIYNNYSELSEPINRYDAGWVLDPNDKTAMYSTIKSILDHPKIVNQKMEAAQKLIREQFNWEKTIEPLALYCENPWRRLSAQSLISHPLLSKKFTVPLADEINTSMKPGINDLLMTINQLEHENIMLKRENDRLQIFKARLNRFPLYRLYKRLKNN